MLRVNKVKLFTQLIIAEIFIIITLISIFIIDSCIDNSNFDEIVISESSLIYSKDDSVPFTGKMQDTLYNKIILEFNVVDGLKQGEFVMLTKEGNFAVQGYMNKNKNHGSWKYFYDNGRLECTGNFDNDRPTGKWTWYNESGTKKCEGIYINGKEEGRWLKYDEVGSPSLLINYSMGEIISMIKINKSTNV